MRLSRACYHLALHRFWLTFGPGQWATAQHAQRPQLASLAGKTRQLTDELRSYGRQAASRGPGVIGKADNGVEEGVPESPVGVAGRLDRAMAESGGSVGAASDAQEDDLTTRFERFGKRMGETYKWRAPAGDRVRGAVAANGARFVMRYPSAFDPDDPARVRAMQEAGLVDEDEAGEQLRGLASGAGGGGGGGGGEAVRLKPTAIDGVSSRAARADLVEHAIADIVSAPGRAWHTRLGAATGGRAPAAPAAPAPGMDAVGVDGTVEAGAGAARLGGSVEEEGAGAAGGGATELARSESGGADGATADEAAADEAAADEAAADEATADEAAADEATADEATADEASVGGATADEATADEAAADEASAGADEAGVDGAGATEDTAALDETGSAPTDDKEDTEAADDTTGGSGDPSRGVSLRGAAFALSRTEAEARGRVGRKAGAVAGGAALLAVEG